MSYATLLHGEPQDVIGVIDRTEMTVTGLAMAVSCFSLIGLPLTAGFIGKLYLLLPAFRGGNYWLAVITLVNAAISAAYYLKIVGTMFLRLEPSEAAPEVTADQRRFNPAKAAVALQEFDRRLPDLFTRLRHGDLLVLTGDHGRDVSRSGGTPTREYVPVLVTGPKLAEGVDLGTRATAADVGQTVVDALRAERLQMGDSFLEALRPG